MRMQIVSLLFWKKAWPGLAVAAALAVVASLIGDRIAWLGGAGLGILSGVVLASLAGMPPILKPGFTAAGKQILQLAVILLGAGLNLAVVWRTGVETLGLMLLTISAVFLAAWLAGRWLGLRGPALAASGVGFGLALANAAVWGGFKTLRNCR